MQQGTILHGQVASGQLTAQDLLAEVRADHDRLAEEMATDTRIQFGTSRFSITAASLLLGAVIAWGQANPAPSSALLYLLPIAILLPASLTVLNRARTRNRKAAYVIAVLDAHRLKQRGDGGIDMQALEGRMVPWETALHLGFRKKIHASGFIRNALCASWVLEGACVYLAGWALAVHLDDYASAAFIHSSVLVAGLVGVMLWFWRKRWLTYKRLSAKDSIQGFIKQWLQLAYDKKGSDWPPHLARYLDLFDPDRAH